MGVAGATLSNHAVIVAGLAGVFAGALSMALGKWISVQNSRAFDKAPAATRTRLVEREQAHGASPPVGAGAADRLMRDRDQALQALAGYELGIAARDIGGSPWAAAAIVFFPFPAGAILSLISFLLIGPHLSAVIGSLCLARRGLFVVGAVITRFTQRRAIHSGYRQVAFGLTAALIIFGIGGLFSVSFA